MALTKKGDIFVKSDVGIEARKLLELMMTDDSYNTPTTYSANTELYPDNQMPFIDKHMNYLCSHPSVNPNVYLSNLRLMTKIRNFSN